MYEEIINNRKQIALIAASDAAQMLTWAKLWHFEQNRIMRSSNVDVCLRKEAARKLTDPRVLKSKRLLSSALHTFFRICKPSNVLQDLDRDWSDYPGYKYQFGAKMKNIQKLLVLMTNKDHRLGDPWSEEQTKNMSAMEKSNRMDVFMKDWETTDFSGANRTIFFPVQTALFGIPTTFCSDLIQNQRVPPLTSQK